MMFCYGVSDWFHRCLRTRPGGYGVWCPGGYRITVYSPHCTVDADTYKVRSKELLAKQKERMRRNTLGYVT